MSQWNIPITQHLDAVEEHKKSERSYKGKTHYLSNFHYTQFCNVSPCVYCGKTIYPAGCMIDNHGNNLCLECKSMLENTNREKFKANF